MSPGSCGAASALTVAALLGLCVDTSIALEQERVCDVRLAVELDPAVPDVNGAGFLSSLLNRHFNYRLELLRQNEQDPADIEVRLTGPGPEYRCLSVIETMRRDARVQSISIESTQASNQRPSRAAQHGRPPVPAFGRVDHPSSGPQRFAALRSAVTYGKRASMGHTLLPVARALTVMRVPITAPQT
jgi:hypothetical protein